MGLEIGAWGLGIRVGDWIGQNSLEKRNSARGVTPTFRDCHTLFYMAKFFNHNRYTYTFFYVSINVVT